MGKKMNNKITTESYFVKRMKDSGYNVRRLNLKFTKEDSRKWMVMVDEGVATLCICAMKNGSFRFYDGDRFTDSRVLHSTDSIEVIIEDLNKSGIVNKHQRR